MTRVDIRLLPSALASGIIAYSGSYVSSGFALSLGSFALIAGIVGVGHRIHSLWILLCIVVAISASSVAWHVSVCDNNSMRASASHNRHITVTSTIKSDPRVIRQNGIRQTQRFVIEARVSSVNGKNSRGRILIIGADRLWQKGLPGQVVRTHGRASLPKESGYLSAILYTDDTPRFVGKPPWYQRVTGESRQKLRAATIQAGEGSAFALVPALSIGDTSLMNSATTDAFYASGLSHLAAVSGGNIAIVVGGVFLAMRTLRRSPVSATTAGFLALVGFVLLARPEPSVLRAAVMAGVALTAFALGRPHAAFPALCFTVIVLTVYDPALASQLGFALSVAATAGLVLLLPALIRALRRYRFPWGIAEALAATIAAQIACLPLLVSIGDGINLASVGANVLTAPAVAPITVLGVLAAIIAPLWTNFAAVLVWIASWPAKWIVGVASYCAELDSLHLAWPEGLIGGLSLAGLLTLVILLLRSQQGRRLVATAGFIAGAILFPIIVINTVAPAWPGNWAIVACDVGQGDALVVRVGERSAVVVDAGPDTTSIDRCLRTLDIRDIPLLLLTHAHADHIGGLHGVLKQRTVGRILFASGQPADLIKQLEATATTRNIPWSYPSFGWRATAGKVTFEVIGGDIPFRGTRSDPNNNSVVLRAHLHGISILLTGDIETEAQGALLESGRDLRANILKVPHHGSAYSSPTFLDAVHPAVAVISVGKDNRYGHPNSSILERLKSSGAKICRTDLDGACAISVVNGGLRVTGANT